MESKEYRDCTLCPNMCHADRYRATGVCRQGAQVRIAWAGLHRGEEPPITGEHGSGMIFFSGCPLHCRYCQNRQISGSDGENYGIAVSEEEMSGIMLSLQDMGAATLNLVTGTHFIPSIIRSLEEARERGLSLPVVWNSSGYESIHGLGLIDPYIDLYLLDCKTLSAETASRFCGKAAYASHIIPVMDWIRERHPYTDLDSLKGTVLRHLVFPGEIASSISFLRLFAERYKDSFCLSFMTQFVPPREKAYLPAISGEEVDMVLALMDELGIEDGFMQDPDEDDVLWIPDFTKDVPFPASFADPDPFFLSLKHR